MEQQSWEQVHNILCIRPDNMGDVLMTTPAIKALKDSGKKVTLLASSTGTVIARNISCIDDVITFDPPWQGNHHSEPDEIIRLAEKLRQERFDAAIIFTVYSQNPLPAALICYLSGIPKVAGYCRENPYGLITDWIPDREPLFEIKHEVTRQLNLLSALGISAETDELILDVPSDSAQKVDALLNDLGCSSQHPWILLHPGVSEERRQYPASDFAKVTAMIRERLGCKVIITGSQEEIPLAESIIKDSGGNVFSLAGKLNVEELIVLIDRAPLLISNNTGPVHIAAARKTPVIVTYALTNPQHAPWKVKHCVLPFDVPEDKRSRNTIVTYAYDKVADGVPGKLDPLTIFKAAEHMLSGNEVPEVTELVGR